MRLIVAGAAIFTVLMGARAASASTMDLYSIAASLGSVIAAEGVCDIPLNHSAIERYIEANVAADDMEFSSTLEMMTEGSRYTIGKMTASARAAHCFQVRRAAQENGLVDN